MDREELQNHVVALGPAAADALLARLIRRCWPVGLDDRTQPPIAVEWMRRGGPARALPVAVDCSCAAGHCPVCN
ncbi:MAG: hypothetical protein QOJ07_823 [Thermoleophilaceae bacterium]|jgi:hypothetical protein|nr:hypothetical protein [Thermoleophilaceae bacterium]